MTLPADHHWRCACGGGHFLTIVWDPDETPRIDAHIEGYLSVEGDNHTPWRDRIKQAWRVLASGHSATRVGVILDAAKAREIAVVLSDFADDATPLGETREQKMQDPEYRRGYERGERARRLWDEAAEQADPEKVARMRAHIDEQAAQIAPQLEEQRARRLKLSDLRTAAEIHERDMRDPEYRREYERADPAKTTLPGQAQRARIRLNAEIAEGLAQSERGETVDLGSFAAYGDDEDGDP